MKSFLQRFGSLVSGVLHGFDRLRFRGSKRLLCHPGGFFNFLWQVQVPLQDYKSYAKDTTVTLCKAIETEAKGAGLYRYLNNGWESKEEAALHQAARDNRRQGLIAVLGCVEPCQIVQVRGNKETKKLEPRIESGKCMHYYHYYLDADYGLRYTRLQSWFPFTMHVGLNGRDWLAQQMTKAGLAYHQKDNSFTWVQDWEAAQCLLDQQRKINERYAEALATVEDKTPLSELVQELGKPTKWKGRSVRALNPLAPADVELLEAINRGEFMLNGFRNRDLRALLFGDTPPPTPQEEKKQAAKVTRLLRLLRAHGVIAKVPKTHRYQVSAEGRRRVTDLLAARHANTEKLLKAA